MRAPHHEGLRPYPEAARGAVSKDTRPALSTSFRAKRHNNCHTREGGYPVRRGLSVLSLTSLEYWVIRPVRIAHKAGDDNRMHVRVLATHCARGLHEPFPKQRAQGMPGACCTRGLVCKDA